MGRAVRIVLEKVNTGVKALDAFEFVTAMYAAQGHELRNERSGHTAKRFEARTPEPCRNP